MPAIVSPRVQGLLNGDRAARIGLLPHHLNLQRCGSVDHGGAVRVSVAASAVAVDAVGAAVGVPEAPAAGDGADAVSAAVVADGVATIQ